MGTLKIKGVSGVRWGGGVKGDNKKQTNGCTKQTTKTRNVLQTHEVVKELRAS
jgi:hypothetical protein